ncbi:hypothetical protein NNO_2068 [Hydrogenimonas sp.]|nr:hypothetical protein NNO_2068 [Hydrogenimonas sp.]
MRRALIVKDPRAKIVVNETHLEISTLYDMQYIGFERIKAVYLNRSVDLSVKSLMEIFRRVPVYFIDKHGRLLAKMSRKV